MNKKYIALIDSGVGGISVLLKMKKAFPNEKYIYIGDNKNAPYGNKSLSELKKLVFESLTLLNFYKIKFLIVACNTLSTSLLSFIKSLCDFPVFGIFPPVEKFLISRKRILFLATCVTTEFFKQIYLSKKKLTFSPQKNLAEDIEENIDNLLKVKIYSNFSPFDHYDVCILGCTHYGFIKNEIFDHFCVDNIVCSEDFIVNFIKKSKIISKNDKKCKDTEIIFLGDSSDKNKNFYRKVVKTC